MSEKFEWLLWTFPGQTTMSDEFIADEGFRVQLMGNTLKLSFERLVLRPPPSPEH